MAGTTAAELQMAIKSMANGMWKGNTADTLGAPVDVLNFAISPITERLGIATNTPFGGSGHFRTMFGMELEDENVAETAGSMISIGGAAKAAMGAAKAAPAIAKTAAITTTALVGMMEGLTRIGNDVKQTAKSSGIAVPKSQAGMIVAAERIKDQVDVKKATELITKHPEVRASSVYNATGVYKGEDGGLRAVISDKSAKSKDLPHFGETKKLDQILDHPELFAAYPELRNTNVTGATLGAKEGSFTRSIGKGDSATIKISGMGQRFLDAMRLSDGTQIQEADILSTLLHEVQHNIQSIEGFTRGGSPKQFLPPNVDKQAKAVQAAVTKGRESADPAIRDAAERFKERFNAKTQDAHVKYENLPGEQEARFTQGTQNYTQEELAANIRNQLKAGVTPQSWDTQKLPSVAAKEPPAQPAQETNVLDKIKQLIGD